MIDEYPILAVAAATAKGKTGDARSRRTAVKESGSSGGGGGGADRLWSEGRNRARLADGRGAAMARRPALKRRTAIPTRLDHRIAMAFLVSGLAAQRPVTVDDGSPIATSFP